MVFTNDSLHFPAPWSMQRPIHEEDERKKINVSIGFKTLPICFRAHSLCMTIFPQWWAYSVHNVSAYSIGMFASFLLNGSERHYPGQIANYTDSLFQPAELICDAVSWRKNDQINHYIVLTVGDSSGKFLSNNKINPYSNSWIGGPMGYL